MFTARRVPVVHLTTAADGWAPAAATPGDDVPLGDVLDLLLTGLATQA